MSLLLIIGPLFLKVQTMSQQLRCIVCSRTGNAGKLAILGRKGLDTLLGCSVQRNDNLESRVITSGPNAVHEACRRSYADMKNVAAACDLKPSVDDILHVDDDVFEQFSDLPYEDRVADISAFNFSKLCFICAKKCTISTNWNKVCELDKESSIRDNILQASSQRNDDEASEIVERIADVDLFTVGAKYHESCFITFMNFSASLIQDHHLSVAAVQQMGTLPAWIIDGGTIPVDNHYDCLKLVGFFPFATSWIVCNKCP